jgi:site-specific DNA recombinase
MVLRMAFPQALAYCRNEGYRTAGIAEPFRLLRDLTTPKYGMVELGGIEPPTSCMPCKRSPN